MTYAIIERGDPLALHALFDSRESAERHLRDVMPVYIDRGYLMDKTLTVDSFVIVWRQARGTR